ncbi:MAG: hypothetical protein NC200_06180 [Candidatus Gastranaerophilales bacterium]|nr:hypothetical protein [Candidatus Gastranaerophilales bacterium]
MKKIILSTFLFLAVMGTALAVSTKSDALAFFNSYVQAANTYSPTVTTMYSPTAKIIREVVKPDGSTVTRVTNTQRYISEMKKGQAIAKVRRYKNYYSNITVTQTGTDTYKVSSLRQPSGEKYKLKAYMIVKKQPDGKWLITEEMMQTKVQMLINAK